MSNKSIGGYVLVDVTGFEVPGEQVQNVPGIYAQLKNALASKKPILSTGFKIQGYKCSPLSTYAYENVNGVIIGSAAAVSLYVDEDDNITINAN